MPDAPPPGPSAAPGPRRLAAALTGVQAAALVAFAAFYGYELVIGEGSEAGRVIMSAVLILVGGLGLGALARGWLGDGSWPRTPTLVWSALLVPVGFGLVQGSQRLAGWLVLGVATVTAVAALRVRESQDALPASDGED